MKVMRPILALALVAILAAGEGAAQQADGARPPPPPNVPLPDARVTPPGIRSLEIRPDTPAERDAFLARRRAEMERRKIETVAPLPAQRITPAPPAPQQR